MIVVKVFNEYFSNIVSNLDIQGSPNFTLHRYPVLNIIKKFEGHASRNKKIISMRWGFPILVQESQMKLLMK